MAIISFSLRHKRIMKEHILKEFVSTSRQFCKTHNIKISDIRQEYFESRPFVSFWVDSKAITSVTFRSFKKGTKYSVVVNEDFSELFCEKFGHADRPVGNKSYSNTWSTYDAGAFVEMTQKFV
ncbi:hypothetical protein D8T49_23360 [Vibrio vulnificus]|uniref:hypothetical protein n=2 Tax=Vibrio vulnificus TaxID=672 RepID=UPI0010231DAE|nr:hypothetical protein [Vibrio vulnificus]EGQ7700446.1 hypothetical protein [Vibrio vulnificus]EGQ7958226.1 hypothetical protein [Vibrio vulnificus]EGQ7988784.1 hypothetical protein [Vibrio vulnificus]EGQ9240197.1 hypothetical protein [Vibrio vulnificus]EGQ9330117.1 hypothetical protein [Vibrio vulnificus]